MLGRAQAECCPAWGDCVVVPHHLTVLSVQLVAARGQTTAGHQLLQIVQVQYD